MTEHDPHVLQLAASDVEALGALAREIWLAHYPGIISVAQIEYMLAERYDPQVVRAELQRADLWWDKLVAGGAMIGFSSYMVLTGVPRQMKVDKLYVHPRHQRAGGGGILLERVAAVAREQNCEALMLAVNKQNNQAIAAYGKHGFHIAEAVVKDIGGGFIMDDYIMVRNV